MRSSLVAVLVLVGIVACAVVASPPRELVAKNDHAALATWYEKEAAHLRQHAKDMVVMAETYEKSPGPSTRGEVPPKIDLVQHCRTLAAMYTKSAEEADALAKAHRDMMRQ
jgi:hypothetical protein